MKPSHPLGEGNYHPETEFLNGLLSTTGEGYGGLGLSTPRICALSERANVRKTTPLSTPMEELQCLR